MIAMLMFGWSAMAQTVVFSETCGESAPSANPRPSPATYEDWDNKDVTFSGTADLRSTGSLSSHVWFAANSERDLIISGINTSGKTNLKLSFKIASNAAATATPPANAAKMTLTVNGTPVTIPDTPTGAQNNYVEVKNLSIPSSATLEIKFAFTAANNPANYGYRLDDIIISSGDAPVLSTNNNLATLTVSTGTLSPAFDPDVISYSVELPAGTTAVPTVGYTLEDAKAAAVKTDAAVIPGTTTVKVTAESGDVKTYSINFSIKGVAGTWIETFESEAANKSTYTAAEFIGTAAKWNAAAVITNVVDAGNNDKKNGTRAARLRDPGSTSNPGNHYIEMAEDKANGAGTISLYHGMYGTHTNPAAWKLEVSTDGGATWTAFSKEVTEVPTTFTKISFTVNIAGNIRIKITKTNEPQGSTNSSSINIDDIEITNYPGTGIITENASALNVFAANGTLFVKNAGAATISVFDLTGRLIVETAAAEIPLAKGIYIVKVGAEVFKVNN